MILKDMRYKNPPVNVSAIIVRNNKVLLGTRLNKPNAGRWNLVGGFVNSGESLEEALKREVKEEAGCTVTATEYFASIPTRYKEKEILAVYFLSKAKGTPKQSSEFSTFKWFEKLPPSFAFLCDKRALIKYFRNRKNLINTKKINRIKRI